MSSDDIPFVRDFAFDYGHVAQVSPLVRRVIAHNPGPYTYTGTGTYIVGHGRVAVIDPGPHDAAHVAALERALRGETVTHIFVTHTHNDHSPAAAALKAATSAPTYGHGPHGSGDLGHGLVVEEGGDMDFLPDIRFGHGDVIAGTGWTIECVHTPGHTSNHLCFALREEKALFTGDHVMGWSTSVIAPPDGDMEAYRASLRLLMTRDDQVLWPTHGAPVHDVKPFVRAFIDHRATREARILGCLGDKLATIDVVVDHLYADIDKRLHPAAALTVYAHLIELVSRGAVHCDGKPDLASHYRIAG